MITQQTAISAADKIGTVTQVYDGALTSDIQVNTFSNIDRLFPVRVVKHGPNVLALPRSAKLWPFSASPGSTNRDAFHAWGIYGQHIYVNPRERVVIVVWSALPKPTGKEVIADEDFFAAAAAAFR